MPAFTFSPYDVVNVESMLYVVPFTVTAVAVIDVIWLPVYVTEDPLSVSVPFAMLSGFIVNVVLAVPV